MSEWRVMRGRVERWAVHYRGEPFHALLCDPPYHLTQPNIRNSYNPTPGLSSWDAVDEARKMARRGINAGGFMGKTWDGGDVAFDPDTWAALASHLLPGAFGMAFASSRGWHRLACAIEDAGLTIHPSIFGWAQGQGFPKATRVNHGATQFDGHRYGLQAMKPALEPIIVWQKPYQGKPAACIAETGAGALWIDGGRISTNWDTDPTRRGWQGCEGNGTQQCQGMGYKDKSPAGRWPANFCLTHDPRCNGACVDGCPVKALGEQSGERPTGTVKHTGNNGSTFVAHARRQAATFEAGDTGTAARFFFNADWSLDVAEQLAAADPVRYCAKAGRKERDAGLEGMPLTRAGGCRPNEPEEGYGGNALSARLHDSVPQRNPHPTVKPITLARWLATLLLPPADYAPRRLLVPFAGSGSEMIGAALAGWEYIMGIEGEREYADIARARLAHWCAQPALMEAA